jgi:transaldolase
MEIEIYADGADEAGILKAAANPKIKGFTTNPTLMKQAGVTDYEAFAKRIIPQLSQLRPDTNLSLEVFADDYDTMLEQAMKIDQWANEFDYNVYVKIPVMNTKGENNYKLIKTLSVLCEIPVNVTAVFTKEQALDVIENLSSSTPSIVSIFAGRIADTGIDPEKVIESIIRQDKCNKNYRLLWASTREQFNLIQANRCGCDIITMTHQQIDKLNLIGKDLLEYSQDTVKMFYNDGQAAGFKI